MNFVNTCKWPPPQLRLFYPDVCVWHVLIATTNGTKEISSTIFEECVNTIEINLSKIEEVCHRFFLSKIETQTIQYK